MQLSDTQIERYSRQIILRDMGGRGQQRLLESAVTLIGHDALTAVAAQYLVAAGIGRIDWMTPSDDAPACASAIDALNRLSPDTAVVRHDIAALEAVAVSRVGAAYVSRAVSADELVRINRLALHCRVPLLVGRLGAHGGDAAVYAGHLPTDACAECVPVIPIAGLSPDAGTAALAGLIGSVLAFEAIAACVGFGGDVRARSLHFDTETSTMAEHPMRKRATCRACASASVADV